MSDNINPEHYKRLPVEAIQIIESAIESAPSAQDAYLHGQVLKYVLRCWNKNGIEDLRKAKWYLDRLIEHFEELPLEANKPAELPQDQSQPPDGWRFLKLDEVIRRGDMFLKDGLWRQYDFSIGKEVWEAETSIRRNRFEVGEKVVRVSDGIVFQVKFTLDNNFYGLETEGGLLDRLSGNCLAPYIKDAT